MYPVYTRKQLEAKKIDELKAIASKLGAVAQDKRVKQSWVEAILEKQPQPVEQPKVEFEIDGDEVKVNQKMIASITFDDTHLTQPWVIKVDGVEVHRNSTWARCYTYITWHYKNGTLSAPVELNDDYQFHNDPQPTVNGTLIFKPVKPTKRIFKSAYKVISNGRDIGLITMRRDGFWIVEGRDTLLDTPYQAAVVLEELRLAAA